MLEVAAKTNTGMVRETNEDNFVVTGDCTRDEWIVPKEPYTNSEAGSVLVVADGMGGLNAGEVASKTAVDSIKEDLTKLSPDTINEKNIKQLLTSGIINAHKKIASNGKNNPETEGMGSTIVVAWIKDTRLHVGWVGDSRCYICRNGKLSQLSKDHSYVQTLVDNGELTKEQAFSHPESNIITQSLGDVSHNPKPDYVAFSLNNNDVLLFCSDGLNSMVRDERIESILVENKILSDSAEMLIQEANNEGGHDNITVLLAKVISGANVPDQKKDVEINDSTIRKHPAVKKLKKTNRLLLFALLVVAIGAMAYFIVPFYNSKKQDKNIINVKKDSVNIKSGKSVTSPPVQKQAPVEPPVVKPNAADKKIKNNRSDIIKNDSAKKDQKKINDQNEKDSSKGDGNHDKDSIHIVNKHPV